MRHRFVHEALVHDSDEELLAVAVPFLAGGLEAGDPTLLGLDPRRDALVCDALGDTTGLVRLDSEHYSQPFEALRLNRELVARELAAGAEHVRFLAQVPHPGTGADWHGWARYEAAINHFFADFPLWGICAYDGHEIPEEVLADVACTHTHRASSNGHEENPAYTDPASFLASCARRDVDPLERAAPELDLRDPSPTDGRHAVLDVARATSLDEHALDCLALAVTETVTNAQAHGRGPVELRAWTARDRVVVAVHDEGPGPEDPYAGMLPGRGVTGGVGLWLSNLMCQRVSMGRDGGGFTVRIIAA